MRNTRMIGRGFGVIAVLMLVGVTTAAGLTGSENLSSERADCPGKVTCPLSGDEVCKDQCPLIDANRDDCPGQVTCPLTGDLVCKDQCPLGASDKGQVSSEALPACCRAEK